MSDFLKCECSHCGQSIEFPAERTGQAVSCPTCEKTVVLTPPNQYSSLPLQTKNNPIEGMKWCFKGAELGDVESMSFLGGVYLLGAGVPKNYAEAVKWLSRAADKGDAIAQGNLGVCYFHGYSVAQNYSTAEKWIRKAAGQGDDAAQHYLGNMYYLGQGLPQNSIEGFKWWLKAAEQGYAEAQNNVAYIYRHGEIIDCDYIEAHKWSSLAAEQGFEDADKDVDAIALKMSAAQLEESRRRIEAFKLKITENKPSDNDNGRKLFARLAALGDLESQAILMANKNPLAAADLLVKAKTQDGISEIKLEAYVERVRSALATEKQKEKLRYFRYAFDGNISKEQASDALDKCAKDFPEVNQAYYNRPATEEQLAKLREINARCDADEPFYDFEEEEPPTYKKAKDLIQEWGWLERQEEHDKEHEYLQSEDFNIDEIGMRLDEQGFPDITREEVEKAWHTAKSRMANKSKLPEGEEVEDTLEELFPRFRPEKRNGVTYQCVNCCAIYKARPPKVGATNLSSRPFYANDDFIQVTISCPSCGQDNTAKSIKVCKYVCPHCSNECLVVKSQTGQSVKHFDPKCMKEFFATPSEISNAELTIRLMQYVD